MAAAAVAVVEGLSARELARKAGYLIRSMPSGAAVVELVLPYGKVLEIGPDAAEIEILRFARRHLVTPVTVRPIAAVPHLVAL